MRIEPVTCKEFVVCAYADCHNASTVYVQLPSLYWLPCCPEHVPQPQPQPQPSNGVKVERYKGGRFWAVYAADGLVVVAVYKRGAMEVQRRLQQER